MSGPFALTSTDSEFAWAVDPRWCSWNGLWGGALLGAALTALEESTKLPVCAIIAQFLAPVKAHETLRLRPRINVRGRGVIQACVDALVKDELTLTAVATLGSTPEAASVGGGPPVVEDPEHCEPRTWMKQTPGGLQDWLDTRIAKEDDRGAVLWVRWAPEDGAPMSAAMVAVAADVPAYALMRATRGTEYGITLDTSLRLLTPQPQSRGDDWLLVDTRFDVHAADIAFATAHVWLRGSLVGLCTQTLRVRRPN